MPTNALIVTRSFDNIDIFTEDGGFAYIYRQDGKIITQLFQYRIREPITDLNETIQDLSKPFKVYTDTFSPHTPIKFVIQSALEWLHWGETNFHLRSIAETDKEEVINMINEFLFGNFFFSLFSLRHKTSIKNQTHAG
jgi:hypothetical protein